MSVGSHLREARLAAGLSIDQLAELTRIRPSTISAMEEGDFGACGGEAYARMQIRSIATALGVGPDPLLDNFDHDMGIPAAPPRPQRELPVSRPRKRLRTSSELADLGGVDRILLRRRNNWILLMVLAVLILIGLLLFVSRAWGSEERPRAASVTSSAAAAVASAAAEEPAGQVRGLDTRADRGTQRTASGAVSAAVPGTIEVSLAATRGRTFVSVIGSDGRTVYEGLLPQGQAITFVDAESLRVVLGNAAAVDVILNGQQLGPAGAGSDLVTLTFPTQDAGR